MVCGLYTNINIGPNPSAENDIPTPLTATVITLCSKRNHIIVFPIEAHFC